MKVLMTGATGFLGSRLLRQMVQLRGYEVTILKRSFSSTWRIESLLENINFFNLDQSSLDQVFKNANYDAIIHCATDYGRKQVGRTSLIETNLLLPLRLLDIALSTGVRNFINTDTMLDKQVSDYALSKRQFREWLQGASGTIRATTVLLEHFYGPGDDPTKFVAKIVCDLVNGVDSLPLTLGEQKRDFIYIDDVVDAFLKIIDRPDGGGYEYAEYEIGTGVSISIREFVEKLKKICGNDRTKLDFGAVPYRANEQMSVNVNISALKALGWMPKVSIDRGLSMTVDYERFNVK
jgi:CDP-paratose synthetase